MKKFSAKNKMILLSLVWLAVSAAMLMYFFNLLDNANQATISAMAKDQRDLAVLQAQSESFKKAKNDLQDLAAKPYQPEDFFTKDITLVKEIETLENLSKNLNLQMQLSGVAGTVNTLASAGTASPIVVVPYNINLTGDFPRVVDFIETLEHLSFVTNLTHLTLNAADRGQVTASLGAGFYLRKQ